MRLTIIDDGEYKTPQGVIGWAYARRARALAKYAPADVRVTRYSHHNVNFREAAKSDVVFTLDYALASSYKQRLINHGFRGVHVVSFNKDSRSRQDEWENVIAGGDWVICNCHERFETGGRLPGTCCIGNGVDLDEWRADPIAGRPLKALYAGGVGSRKKKGWQEVLIPLESQLPRMGVATSFRRVTQIVPQQVMTTEDLCDWYNGGSFILCAAATEGGGPGMVMEGMACGCVPIVTPVGGIPEYIVHQQNGVICERTPESFIRGIDYATEHRERLSASAVETMRRFSYGPPANHAEWFYALFRVLHEGRRVDPFSYLESVVEAV